MGQGISIKIVKPESSLNDPYVIIDAPKDALSSIIELVDIYRNEKDEV